MRAECQTVIRRSGPWLHGLEGDGVVPMRVRLPRSDCALRREVQKAAAESAEEEWGR
jgi:hypothetical protein